MTSFHFYYKLRFINRFIITGNKIFRFVPVVPQKVFSYIPKQFQKQFGQFRFKQPVQESKWYEHQRKKPN